MGRYINESVNQNDQRHHTFWVFAIFLLFLFLPFSTLILEQAEARDSGQPDMPLGLKSSAFHVPPDNPMTSEKVALGRFLFFDKRLSKDNRIACSTCHIPALAFTDGQPVSTGINRQQGGRSAPTALNRAFTKGQFWDGRAATLEAQSVGPLSNPIEHGFTNNAAIVAKLNSIQGYQKLFTDVFGKKITVDTIGQAIATFQRTLLSGNSPFDRFEHGKDPNAISDTAKRGLKLFRGKAQCGICHSGFNFSDENFHNLGVGWGHESVDVGRYNVTKKQTDIGSFKTPTLREIEHTAPYMHDGSLATLGDVIAFYNDGGINNPFLSPFIVPLKLTDTEKKDLLSFLKMLSGEGWQQIKAPERFPQ